MWFAFSIVTIIAWAGSDFFSKKGTNPRDNNSHLRLIIAVGTAMGLHAVIYMLSTGTEYNPLSMIKYLPVSGMYILSMALGYAGLRYIQLSVSSPICNSSGAVTSILCALILKQTMEGLQLFGVVLICAGIFMLALLEKRADMALRGPEYESAPAKYKTGLIAILFPILYCIIDGCGSFLDAWYLENLMGEAEANISYELTFALCALLAFLYLRLVKKERFSFFKEKTFCAAALCETAGQFTYVYALSANAIVSAPLIASYSIFSVLLSRFFLKEKLTKPQYAVIVMVMIGIAILGIFDA